MIEGIRRLMDKFRGWATDMTKNEPLYGDYDIPKRCGCGGEFVETVRSGKTRIVCFRCGKPKAGG